MPRNELPEAYAVGAAVVMVDTLERVTECTITKRTATQVATDNEGAASRWVAGWYTKETGGLQLYGSGGYYGVGGAKLYLADSEQATAARRRAKDLQLQRRLTAAAEAVARGNRTIEDVEELQALLPSWLAHARTKRLAEETAEAAGAAARATARAKAAAVEASVPPER